MAILKGSRYAGLKATGVVLQSGQRTSVLNYRQPITLEDIGPNFNVYTTQTGDAIDALAYRFGGRADLWFVIAELNGIEAPHRELVPGAQLIIPTAKIFGSFA